MKDYLTWFNNKAEVYGDKWDGSDLAPKFIKAFNTGERIRVKVYGEVKTGTVGVTSGWKPVFLLMHNKRCTGSSTLLTHDVTFTTEKVGRYEY